MDPFVKKASFGRKLFYGAVIGFALVAGVLVIGGIAFSFISYQRSGGLPSGDTAPTQVAISNPQNGAQYEVGESIIVEVMALGPNAFLSMELWLDGVLAGVQAAPDGGMQPFSTHFSWLPLEPGVHSLIAAAVDENGQKTMSVQVVVFVVENENGIEILTADEYDAPTVLPAPARGGYRKPSGPGIGASTGPAGTWSGSPGDWVGSLIENEKPAAPELAVSAEQCAANLQIHDLSDNEEGFVVYRQTINSPAWLQVATLSSQSQVEWITYADQGVSGAVTYYVSAFNSQGEAESNLVLVNIDPANCAPEGEKLTAGSVDVALQIPDTDVKRVYCYKSADGLNWERWPQLGFLTPDENGFLPGGPVMQLLPNADDDQPSFTRLDLFMECWGWQGGALVQLGDLFVEDLYREYTGNRFEIGEGISAEVVFEPVELVGQSEIYPVGPGSTAGSQIVPEENINELQTWIRPDIPFVYLSQTTDPAICRDHLPPDAQNLIGQLLYCFPYPAYDPNLGSLLDQPYLVWYFDSGPSCFNGIGENCKSYGELLALTEANGGQVGFDVTSVSNAGIFTWPVTDPNLTMFVVPPSSCTGNMEFSVRMWYKPWKMVSLTTEAEIHIVGEKPEAEIYYGPPSNWVSLPCVPKIDTLVAGLDRESLLEPRQYLDITYEYVEFFEIDDDDVVIGSAQDVELYGYFRVVAPAMGQLMEMDDPCFLGMCDVETSYLAYTRRNLNLAKWEGTSGEMHCAECPKFFFSGYYDFAEETVCQSTNKYNCTYEGQATSYKFNNNTIRVFVNHGDALSLEVNLIDYDDASEDDRICLVKKMTPARTLDEWAAIQGEVYMFYGGMTTSGRCEVKAVINAVNP